MSVPDREQLARVALNRLGEPGDVKMTALVAELGAVRLHDLLLHEHDPHGLRTDVAARLASVDPCGELDRAARLGLRFVVPGDDEWPEPIGDLAAAGSIQDRGGVPVGLWVKGPLRLDRLVDAVAVVGSRAATQYGADVAREIGAVVARSGRVVVSGAAFGIDVAAHRGAISGGAPSGAATDGPTVAVLACGADRVYPQAHREVVDHIAATGAVVSEAAPGCSPQRVRFLARNRLIAALSRGTVVVEAARRSGALNTANWAGRLQRSLMGVPGPVTSAGSAGVHELIRAGAMTLVTGGGDVLEMVGAAGEHLVEEHREPSTARDRLTVRQRQVLDAVPVGRPAHPDSIARVAGLGLLEVRAGLARLLDSGLVELADGGWRLTAEAHG
ncbi:DNA-processing protein DprA [Nocardioides dongxiaopingii]|uniref:DNA-processing protein DprA n=1 Tax=Nocardioides dongxiaopingii TaxID=2576036 RepID=UPI0010C76B2F|nr:DNA-processing protein DprA [Nocardioides dongxiaopingii]